MMSAVNPKLATGEIEVVVVEPPSSTGRTPRRSRSPTSSTPTKRSASSTATSISRRAPLQRTLRVRHRIHQTTRRYFDDAGFLELETPVMVKYTPGGARNFLVPSRMNPGKFFALAESPQLFKQLYMVAGFDRYFQIVKCFRDEDLRLDRQPEFTQIDVEMSFVNQDDVFKVMEGLVFRVWQEVLGIDLTETYPSGRFPQMPFEESMAQYGNDKPDLRFDMPHADITDAIIEHGGGGVSFWKDIADKFTSGQVPPRSPRRDREGDSLAGRERALPRGARQARGVRQRDGGEGARARQGRRGGELDAVAAGEDRSRPSCARRSTPRPAPPTAICSSSSSARRASSRR